MERTNYKRLGDYIQPVDVRNRDLKVTKLMGVSISKEFITSIANIIGTDMSTYKIVQNEQFAFGPVTSRNGDKVSIALFNDNDNAIISQAYTVFKVIDKNKLLPEYLMMWFRRPEFDRYARYKSHGSAREIFDWDEMCNVELPVPSIERQRELVAGYETITRRIRLNEQLCAKLEETAQTIYRKMFVDNINPENLPEGWRWGTIGEFCKQMTSGGTPNRAHNEYWDNKEIPWLKSGEVHNNMIIETEEFISQKGMENSPAKIIPENAVVMAMYGATASQVGFLNCQTTTNQACCNMICTTKNNAAFLFFHLLYHQDEIKRLANGGAQENLSQELISKLHIMIGEETLLFTKFVELLILLTKENQIFIKIQSLLLEKMGKVNLKF